MTNEALLHDALAEIMPAYHLILDGEPQEGAAYRLTSESHVYESDIPIMTRENYQIYIYQREYAAETVERVRQSLEDAGFAVQQGGQTMEDIYYRDELRASKNKEGAT